MRKPKYDVSLQFCYRDDLTVTYQVRIKNETIESDKILGKFRVTANKEGHVTMVHVVAERYDEPIYDSRLYEAVARFMAHPIFRQTLFSWVDGGIEEPLAWADV